MSTYTRLLSIVSSLLMMFVLFVTFTWGLAPIPMATAASEVIYVNKNAPAPGDGQSWNTAYVDLQDALANAEATDEIWVAQGVYTPGNTISNSFNLTSGVKLYGGFDGTETMLSSRNYTDNLTILSGDIDGDDIYSVTHGVVATAGHIVGINNLHVVYADGVTNTAVIDGFTITAGHANRDGGGMYNRDSSPSIVNVAFSGNLAYGDGGGMYNRDSSPSIVNVAFSGNSAYGDGGGGMYNRNSSPSIVNVAFSGNLAYGDGGGMYNLFGSPSIVNVAFSGNLAYGTYGSGGGMHNSYTKGLSLINVTFSGNSASWGGGMYSTFTRDLIMDNVTFSSNSAGNDGGGMHNCENRNQSISNVSFLGNSAGNDGGGMYSVSTSDLIMDNVTFSGNSAGNDGGGMYADHNSRSNMVNVIFSGNSAGNDGGGMHSEQSTSKMNNVTFSNNSADNNGGGMRSGSLSSPSMDNVTFSSNSAGNDGGGMINAKSSPSMHNVTFFGNSAGGNGGGIINNLARLTMNNVTISNNSAGNDGGGMINHSNISPPSIIDVTFSDNSADRDGGAMVNELSSPSLVNVTFSGNTAGRDGGAMVNGSERFLGISRPSLVNVTFSDNSAGDDGGAMVNYNHSSAIISDTIFSGNSAGDDGGAMINYNHTYHQPNIVNTIFSGNSAGESGGAMYNDNSSPYILNSTFADNSAGNNGGGMYNTHNIPRIINTTLSGNSAGYEGGGMYNSAYSQPRILNSTFAFNKTLYEGNGGGAMSNKQHNYPSIVNTIMWGNSAAGKANTAASTIINGDESTPTISYSLIQNSGGSQNWNTALGIDGGNNLDENPLLLENLQLQTGSPAVDAGKTGWYTGVTTETMDLVGNPRMVYVIDMGAHELQSESTMPSHLDNTIFLPTIMIPSNTSPDLIVTSILLDSDLSKIGVIIRNNGTAPVTKEYWDHFRVNVYIGLHNANKIPSSVHENENKSWQSISPWGATWYVDSAALPLAPNETLTLINGDPYYDEDNSSNIYITSGTVLYAQVDAVSPDSATGAILETHEIENAPYNNVFGPVIR